MLGVLYIFTFIILEDHLLGALRRGMAPGATLLLAEGNVVSIGYKIITRCAVLSLRSSYWNSPEAAFIASCWQLHESDH